MLQPPAWNIDIEDDGTTLAVRASGELDITTAPQLLDAFGRANGHSELVCDMTGITFIDSSGVNALVELGRREPESFTLAGASEPVERLLEMTGTAGWFRRA
jgi:anti-sigma B factor antagonist